MKIPCPFCNTEMIPDIGIHRLNDLYFQCPNPNCSCSDGGMTLYNNSRSLKWIEWKRKNIKVKK